MKVYDNYIDNEGLLKPGKCLDELSSTVKPFKTIQCLPWKVLIYSVCMTLSLHEMDKMNKLEGSLDFLTFVIEINTTLLHLYTDCFSHHCFITV